MHWLALHCAESPLIDPRTGARDPAAESAGIGLVPTPAAARLLAHLGGGRIAPDKALREALAPLPLSALAVSPATHERLAGWGLRTLGDCWDLPRAELMRRLGSTCVGMLDRLIGAQVEIPDRYHPPARFSGRLPLPVESHMLDLPLAGLERLLGELECWLRARDAGIQRFVVELQPLRGAATDVSVELAVPAREAAHLHAVARERLARVTLPPVVVAVGVRAQRSVAYAPPPADFWDAPAGEPGERLFERLRARLGARAVHGLTLHADHRPERAWSRVQPGTAPAQEPHRPLPRPLWLLESPVVLATDAAGQPCCEGALELLDGPERIETGWWDGNDIARDYFVGRNPAGMLLWVYRERRVPHAWYVQGLFG